MGEVFKMNRLLFGDKILPSASRVGTDSSEMYVMQKIIFMKQFGTYEVFTNHMIQVFNAIIFSVWLKYRPGTPDGTFPKPVGFISHNHLGNSL